MSQTPNGKSIHYSQPYYLVSASLIHCLRLVDAVRLFAGNRRSARLIIGIPRYPCLFFFLSPLGNGTMTGCGRVSGNSRRNWIGLMCKANTFTLSRHIFYLLLTHSLTGTDGHIGRSFTELLITFFFFLCHARCPCFHPNFPSPLLTIYLRPSPHEHSVNCSVGP